MGRGSEDRPSSGHKRGDRLNSADEGHSKAALRLTVAVALISPVSAVLQL